MSAKNKTLKKSTTIESSMSADEFQKFLSTNAEEAYNRPWHKLDRGSRINRIRNFVDREKDLANYTDEEAKQLLSVLMKAYDKKQLNTKNIVIYNELSTEIEEIKGLVMHRGSNGLMLFQLLEKKTGVTFRKPRPSSAKDSLST